MPPNGPITDTHTESIGQRIKRIRKEQNMTLAEVAAAANLSPSHLSQIERDKTSPSLMTIASVAKALNVSVRDLFETQKTQILVRRATHRPTPDSKQSPYQAELLTATENSWHIQVRRLRIQPNTPGIQAPEFAGEVLGFVLEGILRVEMKDESYDLHAGDSIHFDASVTHRLYCLGDQPCVVLWCSSPPIEDVFSCEEDVAD